VAEDPEKIRALPKGELNIPRSDRRDDAHHARRKFHNPHNPACLDVQSLTSQLQGPTLLHLARCIEN
jgi:hypothetical protein